MWIAVALLLLFVLLLHAVAIGRAWTMTFYAPADATVCEFKQLSILGKIGRLLFGNCRPKPSLVRTPADFNLPYFAHTFYSNGNALEGWMIEADKPRGLVIFFSVYGLAKDAHLEEAVAIYRMGWSVLLVDFPGHGGSDGQRTTLGFSEAHDVVAVVKAVRLAQVPERIVLYGISMAGAAILRALHLGLPQPDGIVIDCAFDSLVQTVRHRIAGLGVPPPVLAELLVLWGGLLHGFPAMSHRPVDFARAVRCPTLHFHGALDRWVTVEDAQRIYQNLAGRKEFVLFSESAHDACYASDPTRWFSTVSAFLETLSR